MDRLLTRTDALGRIERYEYDKNGNLTKFTDRKNQIATFVYDALNRRIGAAFADGSTTSFAYDAVGRLVSATDSVAGRITFVYDNLNRLVQEITSQGSITYSYDAIGRRTTMTASGQQPVSYGYDAASRLVQVVGAPLAAPITLGYDATGRRTSLTYPNNTSTSYAYDAASRLTNILHQGPSAVIDSLTYAYDAAGNRTSITRLNDLPRALPPAVQAAYDAANEQIQFNNSTPNNTFDANGNLTSEITAAGTTTYTWDARNRLTARSGPGINEGFVYDALGRRISKTINGVATSFLYDGNDIVQEIGGGAVGATYLRSLNIDEPFIRQSSSNEFYHTDALGSALALTNDAGAVTTSYSYEAFGKTTIVGSSANPFQYTGRENDGTGLYYYRLRYYSPILHRFVSEDPIEFAGGDLNLYVYVRSNPLGFVDPFGLYWEYSQSTRQLTYVNNLTGAQTPVATGYSGSGVGLNNPNMQNVPGVGPIPQGTYDIGQQRNSPRTGLGVMDLTPRPGTNTFGRDAFQIHGDNSSRNLSASQGCIVLPGNIRNRINNSGDREMRVLP